jgi:hypothetical protein
MVSAATSVLSADYSVEILEHPRPRVLVSLLQQRIWETSMGQVQARTASDRGEFDANHGLCAPRSRGRNPCQFDALIRGERNESAVVRVALVVVVSLEEEWDINLWHHEHRGRSRKPEAELLGPRSE